MFWLETCLLSETLHLSKGFGWIKVTSVLITCNGDSLRKKPHHNDTTTGKWLKSWSTHEVGVWPIIGLLIRVFRTVDTADESKRGENYEEADSSLWQDIQSISLMPVEFKTLHTNTVTLKLYRWPNILGFRCRSFSTYRICKINLPSQTNVWKWFQFVPTTTKNVSL